MKALVGAFNQEKALVGAFSVIVQPVVEPMEQYTALIKIVHLIDTAFSTQKNEVAQITVKHQYGFGKDGNIDKGVGPNKTLVYEIKLVSFEKAKESWQLDADAKLEQVIADAKFCVM